MKRAATACLLAAVLLTAGCGLIGTAARIALPLAGTKLMFSCIPEGTLVDTPDGQRPIEAIRAGETVTGFSGEPVRVLQAHAYAESATGTEFLRIGFEGGARVDLCGNHRIDGRRAKDLRPGDRAGGLAVISSTAYRGVERSYDLLTEDAGYRIAGLPVDSMIEEMYRAGLEGRGPGER